MRGLGLDPVADTRRTYRGLLTAMSRPGTVQTVPAPADHAVVATLVDHEVGVATDDDRLRTALDRRGRLTTAPPDEADVVHAGDGDPPVGACKRGTLVEPSEGATVIYRVDDLAPDAGAGTTLRLSGPGVDGTALLSVSLPAERCRALARARDYPRGVDAVFATDEGVAAVPRSTTVEVA